MKGRSNQFNWPHQIKGTPARTRFALRRESKTKPTVHDQSIFTYSSPGKGANGESGRMGQGGASY